MADWQQLGPPDYRAVPWRNRRGMGWEIACEPPDDDFTWRASLAEITATGPFSDYAGCRRWTLLLTGAGLTLSWPSGATVSISAVQPLADYPGDPGPHCTLLAGRCRVFNFTMQSGRADAKLRLVELDGGASLMPTDLLFCARGVALLHAAGRQWRVAAEETLRFAEPATLEATGAARLLTVAISQTRHG